MLVLVDRRPHPDSCRGDGRRPHRCSRTGSRAAAADHFVARCDEPTVRRLRRGVNYRCLGCPWSVGCHCIGRCPTGGPLPEVSCCVEPLALQDLATFSSSRFWTRLSASPVVTSYSADPGDDMGLSSSRGATGLIQTTCR